MREVKVQILRLFSLIAAMCVLACEPAPEKTTSRFSIERIKVLIDRGDLETAEDELTEHLAYSPHDDQARILLASIEVNRAGISLKHYFRLYRIFQQKTKTNNQLFRQEIIVSATSIDPKAGKVLTGVDRFYGTLLDVRNRFEQIDSLNRKQAQHMKKAIEELNKIQGNSRGQRFYRGIIKLIYLKYLLEEDAFFSFNSRQICETSVRDLMSQTRNFQIYFSGLLRDLSYGYPQQQKSINEFVQNFDQVIDLFRFALSSGKQDQRFSQLLGNVFPKDKVKCDF